MCERAAGKNFPRCIRFTLILLAFLLLAGAFLPAGTMQAGGKSDGDSLLEQARLCWKEKKFDKAAEAYLRLRDRFPRHEFVLSGNAQFWLWCSLGNAGRIKEEIEEIERFLDRYPKHSSCGYALYFLGTARRKAGDAAGARRAWDELLEKYPDDRMAGIVRQERSGKRQAASRHAAPDRTLGVDFIHYAVKAAAWLESVARDGKPGLWWPEKEGEDSDDLHFYSGSAGPCFFFLNLYRLTGRKEYAELARKGAAYLIDKDGAKGSRFRFTGSAGLYTGDAGIGHVLLCFHREFGDTDYLDAARAAADTIVTRSGTKGEFCGWGGDTDIISGAAGIGLFLLEMHAATGEKRYVDCAVDAADWLIAQGVPEKGGLKWKPGASLDRFYTGFSHGTAGIAFYLARVFERTGKKRFLDSAEAGARWLEKHAVSDGKGLKWFHYQPDATDRFQTGWCHGPAGTGRLFLELFRQTGRGGYLKTAKKGAAWLMAVLNMESGAGFWGLSACCGTAGVGDYFLDLFLAGGDEVHLEYAATIAGCLMDRARLVGEGCCWSDSASAAANDKIIPQRGYMKGAAGVGSFFLKLHAVCSSEEHRILPFADMPAYREADRGVSRKQGEAASYAVLTNLAKNSGYYKAVRKLIDLHGGAVVSFDPGRMNAARRKLCRLDPRYVAVVLEPDQIDANVQRRMIALSTKMDSDPYCDFAFGFVTGATAHAAVSLVERSARVSKKGIRKRKVSASVVSGMESLAYDGGGSTLQKELGFETRTIYWSCVEDDPDVLEFVDDHFAEIEDAGVVSFGGCGDPEGIWLFSDERNRDSSKHWPFDPDRVGFDPRGEMPRIMARRFRKVKLGSAVVWSGTCHSGVLHRAFVENDIVSTFGRVDRVTEYFIPRGKSLAKGILAAGPSAYIAPIGANHGFACLTEFYRALSTGMPLGEVMRTRYNEIVFAAGGELDVMAFVPGAPEPREDPMRGGGVNRALFGDPLFAPFTESGREWLEKKTELIEDWGEFCVSCKVLDTESGMFWDMFGNDNANAERIYTTADLPVDYGPVGRVTAGAREPDGEVIEVPPPAWAVERIDGRDLIHLQVNAPRGSLKQKGTTVEFRVYPRKNGDLEK